MKKMGIIGGVLLAILLAGTASADVIFYDEDFGDRGTYPNGSPALQTGDIDGQIPYDYDTYAYPPGGALFANPWVNMADDQGLKAEVVNIDGPCGQVVQVWGDGIADIGWGAVSHNAFINMFRPVYDLPLVIELKFRPQYYDPHPYDENANPAPKPWYAAPDMDNAQFSFGKETALKWRFFNDSFVLSARYCTKYRLYYDGTVAQSFQVFGEYQPWATVDIGGWVRDENDHLIPGVGASNFSHFSWDPRKVDENGSGIGEWLEYRFVSDPAVQEKRIYLTDKDNPLTRSDQLSRDENGNPVRDENGNILDENGNIWDGDKIIPQFTISPGNNGMPADAEVVYMRNRQMGMFNGGADQTAFWDDMDEWWYGDTTLDGSKGTFEDVSVYYLGRPTWTERISGSLTVEYPYYCHYKLLGFEWQLRPPAGGGEPKKPVVYGVEDLQLWDSPVQLGHGAGTAEPDIPIVRDYTIGLVPAGTFDVSFKQRNRLAYTIQNLAVPSTNADFTLYAGDAGGDFVNFYDEPSVQGISRPDNDCDSWDLATVTTEESCGYTYCQKHPATGLSIFPGESGDFDNDGLVTTWDLAAATTNQGRLIYGKWYFDRNLKGKATIEYPGWQSSAMSFTYQVRNPGLPPTAPLYQGTVDPDDVTVSIGYPCSVQFQIAIPGIAPVRPSTIDGLGSGTYDLALKQRNHIADVVEIVVPLADSKVEDITGYVLWAGDADGDDNVFTVQPPDGDGDNDVDLTDYYTLYYQYTGGLPLTTGYNADFNCDGAINLSDYYGLFYGYQNAKNPGNWY